MVKLLRGVLHFWKPNDLKMDKKYNDNINRAYRVLSTAQHCFLAASFAVIVLLILKPALSKSAYIFDCWVPDSVVLETAMLLSQYYSLFLAGHTAPSFDFIYVAYSFHLIVQLRLLKHELKHLGVCKDILVVRSCIRHHQFLLL